MKIEPDYTPYGEASIIDSTELVRPPILFLGGWQQNPRLMHGVQRELARQLNAPSIGMSAFDVTELSSQVDAPLDEALAEDKLLTEIPLAMIKKAQILRELAGFALHRKLKQRPETVIAHCAGANVLLLARYIDDLLQVESCLPHQGVLVEPMIVEDRSIRQVTKETLAFDKLTKAEPQRYISLQSLQADNAKKVGMEGAKPMLEILGSRGMTLLFEAFGRGDDFRLLVGENDIAAPAHDIVTELEEVDLSDRLYHYETQPRTGHGFLLAEPVLAVTSLRAILEAQASSKD